MENDDELGIEANWYDEFGGALESVAAQYRRAARLLRVAGAALRPDDLAELRRELGAITGRVVAATTIGARFADQEGSGVK